VRGAWRLGRVHGPLMVEQISRLTCTYITITKILKVNLICVLRETNTHIMGSELFNNDDVVYRIMSLLGPRHVCIGLGKLNGESAEAVHRRGFFCCLPTPNILPDVSPFSQVLRVVDYVMSQSQIRCVGVFFIIWFLNYDQH